MKLFILFSMFFMHIVDDYYLQGILAKMKQKKWWKENTNDNRYRYDYIIALLMHAFSWAFLTLIPIVLYLQRLYVWLCVALLINAVTHCIVDDLKANKLKINLIADQSIHIIQLIITWIVFVVIL